MSIEEVLRDVAQKKYPSYGFVLEDWNGIDRAVDKVDLPAIVVFLVESGTLTFKNGRCKDEEDIVFAFIDKVPRDADGDENTTTCTELKKVAKSYIGDLQKTGYFEPINQNVEYTNLYEILASNCTGLMFRLRLQEAAGECV